ncbi:MAG: hypothetical protein V1927_06840 [Candidatus Omnitrophota bacterium]
MKTRLDMEKLNLPIGKWIPEQHKWLSMNEYIEFVNFTHKYFHKNKLSKKDELIMRVDVPFSIK